MAYMKNTIVSAAYERKFYELKKSGMNLKEIHALYDGFTYNQVRNAVDRYRAKVKEFSDGVQAEIDLMKRGEERAKKYRQQDKFGSMLGEPPAELSALAQRGGGIAKELDTSLPLHEAFALNVKPVDPRTYQMLVNP